jgi:hypothetical protein
VREKNRELGEGENDTDSGVKDEQATQSTTSDAGQNLLHDRRGYLESMPGHCSGQTIKAQDLACQFNL